MRIEKTVDRGSKEKLYVQIYSILIEKIDSGEWPPGTQIPTEDELCKIHDVSKVTVREAIQELVREGYLKRQQGKGTFVSNHNDDRALFHFFHITDDNGNKLLPDSRVLNCRKKTASRFEAAVLHLTDDAPVIRVERVRSLSSTPTIVETIVLPADPFEALQTRNACKLPNMLYGLYEQQFGITIHSAEEKLRATAANKREAKLLKVAPGTPLLEIERVALTLNKVPVELRISRCSTKHHHYQNTIF